MTAFPKTFGMPLIDAVLVFDASHADETGMYATYSIDPEANERFKHGEWDVMRPSPHSDRRGSAIATGRELPPS